MKANVQTTQAIVSHAPEDGKRRWILEDVQVSEPGEYEAIVEMVASGVCHTDLGCGTAPDGTPGFPVPPYPRVLGHEGTRHKTINTSSTYKTRSWLRSSCRFQNHKSQARRCCPPLLRLLHQVPQLQVWSSRLLPRIFSSELCRHQEGIPVSNWYGARRWRILLWPVELFQTQSGSGDVARQCQSVGSQQE